MQGLRRVRSTHWKNLFSGHSGAAWESRSSRCPWFRPSRRKGTKLPQLNPTSTEPLCWVFAASLSWLVFNLIPFLSGWSGPGGTCGPQRTSRYWNSRTKGKTGGDDCLRNRKSDADCDWLELRIVLHIFKSHRGETQPAVNQVPAWICPFLSHGRCYSACSDIFISHSFQAQWRLILQGRFHSIYQKFKNINSVKKKEIFQHFHVSILIQLFSFLVQV